MTWGESSCALAWRPSDECYDYVCLGDDDYNETRIAPALVMMPCARVTDGRHVPCSSTSVTAAGASRAISASLTT